MLDIYNSFSDFSIFYIIATAIVVLGIIFNNELCYLEDKFDEYIASKKAERKRREARQQGAKSKKPVKTAQKKSATNKKGTRFAA